MANNVKNAEADVMVEAKGKLELFFDKYGNKILWALVIVGIIVCGFFVFRSMAERRAEAKNEAASVALAAAVTAEDFAAVVADFEGSDVANNAAYMAGAEYLKAGDLVNAKKYLEMYVNGEGAAAELINAQVYGLRGDIAVEENDLQSAVELFKKAASASDDSYSFITFNEKLALVYAAMGDEAASVECYKNIVKEYPATERQYQRFIKE